MSNEANRTPAEIAAEAMANRRIMMKPKEFLADAQAALSALEKEGWVLVPREPTPKMLTKACNALKRHIDSFTECERIARWPSRREADGYGWRVPNKEKHAVHYRAMIAARPHQSGKP